MLHSPLQLKIIIFYLFHRSGLVSFMIFVKLEYLILLDQLNDHPKNVLHYFIFFLLLIIFQVKAFQVLFIPLLMKIHEIQKIPINP